ncbi:MAG: energy-coupling factor transporter transmembrane component T [Eubacteriales bacterium]
MFKKRLNTYKGCYFKNLHPAAALVYFMSLLLVALLFSHPLYLTAVLVVTVLAIRSARVLKSWKTYLKFSLLMVLMIVIINPLVSRAGSTVLLSGPQVPLLGGLIISLEAVFYGLAMGTRLLIVLSVFCLYNNAVHPDQVLSLFSRFTYRPALVISMGTRLIPRMKRDFENIQDLQKVRGFDYTSLNLRGKFKLYRQSVNTLIYTSLEDAWQISEAMHSRAFGSGPRSRYERKKLRPGDLICLVSSCAALAVSFAGKAMGAGSYAYYPKMDYFLNGLWFLLLILTGLLIPVITSWGWDHCRYLRSRI